MRLQVSVQLRGEIIEDTVVHVADGLRLGEHPRAAVAFPGLDLVLQRDEDAVLVRGRRLVDGESLELGVDDVVVTLRPVTEALLARTPFYRGDMVLPVVLLAMVLSTLTFQTVQDVLIAKADVSQGVARTVEALLLPPRPDDTAPAIADVRREPPLVQPPPGARYVDSIE
jgi:hypothetical protein